MTRIESGEHSNLMGGKKMKRRTKSLSTWAPLSVLTLLLIALGDTREFTNGGLLIAWAFFSWNLLAYWFDGDMWPVVFIELEGSGKGYALAREAVFWSTAAVYLLLLATIVFAR
ncbi:MAG: hypothetical protein IBJ14_01950 [Hydrogenophaga sp.]|nr:hypothetical protein [Hydrogenophaga sp.]